MAIIRRLKILFQLFILISILTATISYSAENIKDEGDTVTNSLYHIKYVIMNKFASGDIVNFIERAIDIGAVGYKVVQPTSSYIKDMGWLVEDSKGRVVFRVLFTFKDNGIVHDGRFLVPPITISDIPEVHQYHADILSRNYTLTSPNNYDLGDGCRGVINLFKSGVRQPGLTVITVECPK